MPSVTAYVGAGADDGGGNGVGTLVWANPNDIANGGSSPNAQINFGGGGTTIGSGEWNSAKLTLNGTTVTGSEMSPGGFPVTGGTVYTIGGATSLWGLSSPTASQMNSANFGFCESVKSSVTGTTSHYLLCTMSANAFAIASNATINGIQVTTSLGNLCFPAGTKVMTTQKGQVNIEDVQVGDEVLTFVPQHMEGEFFGVGNITNIGTSSATDMLTIQTANHQVTTTTSHPFECIRQENDGLDIPPEKIMAAALNVGDFLFFTSDAPYLATCEPILSITPVSGEATVYSLSVTDNATYFANGFAVYNKVTGGITGQYVQIHVFYTTSATTGTFSATEAKDAMSATGKETFTGTLASTQAKDTMAASGNFPFIGALASTEALDVMAASGKETFIGTLASTEALDVMAASGKFPYIGNLASIEAKDIMGASGKETFTGIFSVIAALDAMAASGNFEPIGALITTAAADRMTATGTQTNSGILSATENNDFMAASGQFPFVGSLVSLESKDIMAASGKETIAGTLYV